MFSEVIEKVTGGKHNISLSEIAKLPAQLNDPILLFKGSVGNNQIKKYVQNQIALGNLIDASSKKAPNWFTSRGLQLPKLVQTILDANNSIPNSSETVNKNSSTQNDIKQSQLEIIKETNPMWDDYHTGIRTVDNIRTWEEILGLNDEREGQFVWGDFSREDAKQAVEVERCTQKPYP